MADCFVYSYDGKFIQNLLKDNKEKSRAPREILKFYRYVDDVLSLYNQYVSQYVHFIYTSELVIENTANTRLTAAYMYLDLFLNIEKMLQQSNVHDV